MNHTRRPPGGWQGQNGQERQDAGELFMPWSHHHVGGRIAAVSAPESIQGVCRAESNGPTGRRFHFFGPQAKARRDRRLARTLARYFWNRGNPSAREAKQHMNEPKHPLARIDFRRFATKPDIRRNTRGRYSALISRSDPFAAPVPISRLFLYQFFIKG